MRRSKWRYVKREKNELGEIEKKHFYFNPEREDVPRECYDACSMVNVSPYMPDPCNEYSVHLPWIQDSNILTGGNF